MSKQSLGRLYITVETTSRELEAKTLLACHAAAEGFDVVIGLEDMIRRLAIIGPRGIFYDKSTHTEYPGVFATMRRLGHLIAVNDEEGLLAIIPEQYRTCSLTPQADRTIDVLFTWGEYQKNLVSEILPNLGSRSISVGNARMDLLRQELRPFHQVQVDRIRSIYGPFILINTRWSLNNNIDGAERVKQQIEAGDFGPPHVLKQFYDQDVKIYHGFQDMIQAVAKRFPDKLFIIRPHPSESLVPWQQLAQNFDNVRVVREGNVHQWILASELVIHHGCTTAIESFFLEIPCVSYHPIDNEKFVHGLPEAVSYQVHDLETLYSCIAGELDEHIKSLRPDITKVVRKHIASVDGSLAITETVRHLKGLVQERRAPEPFFSLSKKFQGHLRSWHRLTKFWLRKATGGVKPTPVNAKWKPLNLEDFSVLVRQFFFVDPRFEHLEISQAYLDCFRLRLP